MTCPTWHACLPCRNNFKELEQAGLLKREVGMVEWCGTGKTGEREWFGALALSAIPHLLLCLAIVDRCLLLFWHGHPPRGTRYAADDVRGVGQDKRGLLRWHSQPHIMYQRQGNGEINAA